MRLMTWRALSVIGCHETQENTGSTSFDDTVLATSQDAILIEKWGPKCFTLMTWRALSKP
jgi:hypothetical protein